MIALAAVAAVLEVVVFTGASREDAVRAAVAAAVREATGPDPASSCSALSPAGLSEVSSQFGDAGSADAAVDQLDACRQLVPRLRAQATRQQLADLAGGSVRTIQFRSDGSALVVYLAADRRLGAELTMSERGGRWLIDSVAGGAAPTS
jgi:hypothetical protein